MKTRLLALLAATAVAFTAQAQTWQQQDIGSVGQPGTATIDPAAGTASVQGAGADIYGTSDAFHFAYQSLTGDGEIIVRVATQQNTNGWAKAGLMLRDGLAANAANVFVAVTPSNGVTFQSRASAGATTSTRTLLGAKAPYWLKLVREGGEVRAYASLAGGQWVFVARETVSWGPTLSAGLAVTSHVKSTLGTAEFDGLAIGSEITDEQWHGLNLGTARPLPDTTYDEATGTFTLRAGGTDFEGTTDSGYVLYQPASGDLEVVARVLSVGNTDSWAKCGVTIRGGTGANAAHASIYLTPSGKVSFQSRSAPGAGTVSSTATGQSAPRWLRVTRQGTTFRGYMSTNGALWSLVGVREITMDDAVCAGLALTSHKNATLTTAQLDEVTVLTDPTAESWLSQNIGGGQVGSATLDPATGLFTINGSGKDIEAASDAFHFVYQYVTGDATLTARLTNQQNTHAWAKAGLMIRGSDATGSAMAFIARTPGNGLAFQRRLADGTAMQTSPAGPGPLPRWLRLDREGATITTYTSADSETWVETGSMTLPLEEEVLLGMAVTAHNAGALSTVEFADVVLEISGPIDSDGDGLDDAWEIAHFGNLDRDGTGDSDRDGLSDAVEFALGLDPTNASDARGDLDGDGRSNLREWLEGTNPLVANSTAPGPLGLIVHTPLE